MISTALRSIMGRLNFFRSTRGLLIISISTISLVSLLIMFSVIDFESPSSLKFNTSSPINSDHTILLWTTFFKEPDYINRREDLTCEVKNCVFTSDRKQLANADAVIFHIPDFDENDIPHRSTSEQVWILLSFESPPHTSADPFNHLNGLINWTATYRTDSDITLYPNFTKRSEPLSSLTVPIELNRNRSIYWLVSNCETESHRETYVQELSRFIDVDIYGDCGTEKCLPKMSSQCYEKLSPQYYFYLAFENSICKDYVTEKFHHLIERPLIPIVLGGADHYYYNITPPKSFIDALDYEPQDLAGYLRTLMNSSDKYLEYFEWRKRYKQTNNPYPCQICRLLNQKVKHRKVWTDLPNWWFGQAGCRSWKEAKE